MHDLGISQSSRRYLCDISKLPASYGLIPNAALEQTGGKSYNYTYYKLNRLESDINNDGTFLDIMTKFRHTKWKNIYELCNIILQDNMVF